MRDLAAGRAAREFLLLGLAIAFFYGVLLWAPLIYDDRSFILANPGVVGPWAGARTLFYAGAGGEAFEPLLVLLHRALFAASGARPFLYRATSLALHWANAGLVLALFSRDLRDRRLAFLAALLFAVFPANVEALAVSTFKKHLLVALFTLSALLLQDRRSWPAAARVGGAWLLFALGLACKETAVVLPSLAAARLLRDRRGAARPKAAELAALFGGWAVLLGAYVLLRVRAAPRAPGAWAGGSGASNLLTSSKILDWCLGRLAAPWPLSLEHSLAPASWPPDGRTLLWAAGAAAALIGTGLLYTRDKRAWFGAAWVLIALAPFLNLFPSLNYSLAADRYLYLASAGFFFFAAVLIERGVASQPPGARRRIFLALLAVALAYACSGMRYAALFADPREIWANAALRAPGNPRAHGAYGAALAEAGRDGEAVVELRRALALDPGFPDPYLDLAAAESRLGRGDEAIAVLEERVRRRPDAAGWRSLGVYRLKAGRLPGAFDALRTAQRLAPGDPRTALDLGYAQLEGRRWAEAEAFFRAAAAAPALRARALAGLGEAAAGEGRAADAAVLFERALALEPRDLRAAEGRAKLLLRR